jgi:hypothetical protein
MPVDGRRGERGRCWGSRKLCTATNDNAHFSAQRKKRTAFVPFGFNDVLGALGGGAAKLSGCIRFLICK